MSNVLNEVAPVYSIYYIKFVKLAEEYEFGVEDVLSGKVDLAPADLPNDV